MQFDYIYTERPTTSPLYMYIYIHVYDYINIYVIVFCIMLEDPSAITSLPSKPNELESGVAQSPKELRVTPISS